MAGGVSKVIAVVYNVFGFPGFVIPYIHLKLSIQKSLVLWKQCASVTAYYTRVSTSEDEKLLCCYLRRQASQR
jgi:hypothetical protein